MASWQEAKVSEETGELGLLWQWRKTGQVRTTSNAGLWGDRKKNQGGFLDGQDKVRGAFYSVGHKRRSAQSPSFPLPLLDLSVTVDGVAGDLLLLVIFQEPMWITMSRNGALEVSRASISQCAHKA